MTLLRFVQRGSILAGMTFASLAVHSNPAHAEDSLYCVTASNGKTACGTLKVVERACITTATGSTVCGKYKPVTESQRQEASKPVPSSGYRKEVDNFVLTLESCRHIDRAVLCQMKIFNKGKRRSVSIASRSSILVDLSGNSYPSYGTDFGGGPGSSKAEIDSNTDIIVGISFGNSDISKQVVKAQILNLVFEEPLKPIQFRNVPISN